MPLYLDRHALEGATAEDVALAHVRDLDVQDRYGARYLSYWFDYDRQAAFCLVDAPTKEAAEEVHREAHGMLASQIIEVEPRQIEQFLGSVPEARPAEPYVETAFRAIMFTDVEGSTTLTQQLGDALSMRLLRRHDEIVRAALQASRGTEVKHTGDGIMASFTSGVRAVECAVLIQRRLAEHALANPNEAISVRVGLSAGEPVTENGDLFGAAVQLAARLCAHAQPGTILVSTVVRDLAMGQPFTFGPRAELVLRGFDRPVDAQEIEWAAGWEPDTDQHL